MAYLGIVNLRTQPPDAQLATYVALGQQGIKFDIISSNTDLPQQIAFLNSIAPYVALTEGPNEVNTDPVSYNGLSGAAAADAYQADFYNAVHSDPALANVAVLPFSLSVGGSITGYGNVAAYADAGNVHGYASDGVPPYYMLTYAVNSITTTPGKPVYMTETGYYTLNDGQSGVNQDVQAKWSMDTLLQNSADGVVQTYFYQLENDFANPANDSQNNYGLFNVDGSPKQSAIDIHNLTTILADPGANASTFTPGSLAYTVSGLPQYSGFQNLYAKSDGSFDIALWYEPVFFNSATGVEAAVASVPITVVLGGYYNVSVFDPVTGTAAISTAQDVTSVQLSLGTDPLIVSVTAVPGAPPVSANPPFTIGSGPDAITLGISEDAWLGDAQYTVAVDGNQIGGVQTASALHDQGQSQAVTVAGSFGAGNHTVTVTYLNDAYGGSSQTDRNLFVDNVTVDGVTTAGAALLGDGSQNFGVTIPAGTPTPPPSSGIGGVVLGSGPDSITVGISEDAWLGNAQFTLAVDGNQIGGVQTADAIHGLGQSAPYKLEGSFGAGQHIVTATFLNDAYGGTPSTDRNLYVDSATAGGVTTQLGLVQYGDGSTSFNVTLPASSANITATTLNAATAPTLAFINATGAAPLDAGTGSAPVTLTGAGPTTFLLHAGAANGDVITNFAAGDFLELTGYGAGATLTQINATTWQAASTTGPSVQDQIHFSNAASVTPANYLFK